MRKFYYVELLRFFSALSVLIYHYQHFFKPHSTFSSIDVLQEKFIQPFYSYLEILYNYGSYGVPMFWSISGFVFAFVYLGRQKDITGKKFFINRFSRLYPLHFATLIIVALLQIVNYKFSGSFQIYALNDIYHFFLNLFFISGWGFEKGYSFNAPIWSVSIELIIYMLFFFTIINLNRYKVKFALLIYLLLLIVDKTEIAGGDESVIALFVACGKLFYSGVIVFLLYEKVEKKLYLIFLSIFLIIVSFVGNFKMFLFFPSMLLFFAALEIFIHDKFKKVFEFFGNLTYAMYLLHIPVQLLIIFTFNYFNIFDEIFISNYFFIFYIFLMMLLSFLCFKFYERPLFNKIRSSFS
tara:strand:+ start:3762 stop:4817 length:1056 start_codon:yes stop_codon:yes gene_type:complete